MKSHRPPCTLLLTSLLATQDGSTLTQLKLTGTPIFDGMIAADGQLYICTEQGDFICMGASSK